MKDDFQWIQWIQWIQVKVTLIHASCFRVCARVRTRKSTGNKWRYRRWRCRCSDSFRRLHRRRLPSGSGGLIGPVADVLKLHFWVVAIGSLTVVRAVCMPFEITLDFDQRWHHIYDGRFSCVAELTGTVTILLSWTREIRAASSSSMGPSGGGRWITSVVYLVPCAAYRTGVPGVPCTGGPEMTSSVLATPPSWSLNSLKSDTMNGNTVVIF